MNFLKIPWQEEVVRKTNQNIIVRGARGSGKTYAAIRWAVENTKRGLDVAYIIGVPALYDQTKRKIINELDRQNVEITGGFMGSLRTENGRIHLMNLHSHQFQGREPINHDILIIDDADLLNAVDFRRLRFSDTTRLMITGAMDRKTMDYFLTPHVLDRYAYHEFSYLDMLQVGLMKEGRLNNLKKELSPEVFTQLFGPWTTRPNKDRKHMLDRYDQ